MQTSDIFVLHFHIYSQAKLDSFSSDSPERNMLENGQHSFEKDVFDLYKVRSLQ